MKSALVRLPERNVIRVEKRYDIHINGQDNAYPTNMERLINSSPTAKSCAKTMAKFIAGAGFTVNFSDELYVGKNADGHLTLEDVLKQVAYSIAYQNAFALHFNYNLMGQITSVTPVPYKHLRFGLADTEGYKGKVVMYDNWDYSKEQRIRKDKFVVFDVFNSRKEVVQAQIEAAGGLYKYNGQILVVKMEDGIYPLSPIDCSRMDANTEYQLALFKNRTTRKGFVGKKIVTTQEFTSDEDREEFQKDLKNIQGMESEADILHIETNFTGDDKTKMVQVAQLDSDIKTDLFNTWEQPVTNNIRKAFNNIPTVLVDFIDGKLGNTSGESFKMAQAFYNAQTSEERNKVSRTFKKLFANFYININPANDWSIKQLDLLADGTTSNQ